MVKIMGIINLTPDSFFEKSRYNYSILESTADIVDVGAISMRPGAEDVSQEEEWRRLKGFIENWHSEKQLSVDTTRATIVRKVYEAVGPFIVNDISAGEDDAQMLKVVGELALPYIAMHKRGNPRTMDALACTDRPIMETLCEYFAEFEKRAEAAGVKDWILDPGLGFAKTAAQNVEIIEKLEVLKKFGRPILIGAADKRFTEGRTEFYHLEALKHGADILRVHDVEAANRTYAQYQSYCEHHE